MGWGGAEELEKPVSGGMTIRLGWYLGPGPHSFLHLWDLSSEVTVGTGQEVTILEGGLGKRPQMWGGAVRWRKGETRALNTAEGKKEKKQHTLPCFCVVFCFSFILGQNHHGDVMGEHAQAQPLGGVDMFGEVLIGFRSVPRTVQSDPVAGLAMAFSLPLLRLLQAEGLQDLLPSRWWPGTGGWVAGSSARAPRWNCLSPRTSCTCSGWQKPHCSRSGTS